MSLQEVFYLVAIIFMSVVLIFIVVISVLTTDLINKLRNVARSAGEFVNSASEKGNRILDTTEAVIPKIVDSLSVTDWIKKIVAKVKKL